MVFDGVEIKETSAWQLAWGFGWIFLVSNDTHILILHVIKKGGGSMFTYFSRWFDFILPFNALGPFAA